MHRNIAVVGKMAAGKTTLADRLIKDQGYTRISFASRLKQIAAEVYNGGQPIVKGDEYVVIKDGADAPTKISGRQLLQEFGQSVKAMDRDLWIRYLDADVRAGVYGKPPYVIDDCRFPYEANFLREKMGFVIVKLDTDAATRTARYERLYGRPPTVQELRHPSEKEVDNIVEDLLLPGDNRPEELARILMGAT